MIRSGMFGLLFFAVAGLCGCASSHMDDAPSLIPDSAPSATTTAGGYQLSAQELAYDCKKLTGVMQVRILQIRDYESRSKSSSASRAMQSITTPIFGGTRQGMDPDGQYQRDRAMLDAYNARLAEKHCKTYDIDAELQKTDINETPRPIETKAQ